ncbi:MAG TPA: helix-turn-helix domain-containing protein [Firmicutes bacterium]|jgi:transcriptional regulator GlxA family with amidase domain|nr:helix-turn-helix domain-containing protein [Candidatus Fermentithermobacillaceae bacterium]
MAREAPQSLSEKGLSANAIESLPYPIHVYASDGTSVLMNEAMLIEYHSSDPGVVVGKYNVLGDPAVIATGRLDELEPAFKGETVFFHDIRVPLEDISERYGIRDFDVESVYQDITVFPALDDLGKVTHVAALLINRRVYRSKDEIEKAKEFIESHWHERFDVHETASATSLSKDYFTRLFKKHTGKTPYAYYLDYKMSKLAEKLLDTNLSISEVFASCNVRYSGNSARLFRRRFGVSPMAYRNIPGPRTSGGHTVRVQVEDTRRLPEAIPVLPEEKELLAAVFESFPYPIQIFSLDGTAVMINQAALEMIGIRSRESHIGKYNAFKDPIVNELAVMNKMKQVLSGKTVYLTDFNASYRDMIRYFNVVDRDIQMISSDIVCFPLKNAGGEVEFFAALFIFKRVYRGKEEIGRGRQYIETHLHEPFDADKAAQAACLSRSHFAKLFKKHMGVTPHQYYTDCKIKRLKEKLLDTNLSIAQAFAACHIDYNSHSSRVFRESVGMTPSVYRETFKVK